MLSDWRRSRLTDSSEFWISVVHQFFNRNDFLVSSKVCTMYNILTLIYYYNTVTAFANIMFKLEYAKTNPLVGQGIDRCASASTYVILNLRSLYHLKKVIWLKVTVFDTELITFKDGFYQFPSISHLPRVSEWNIRMKVSNFIYLSACLNFRQNRRQFYIHSWYDIVVVMRMLSACLLCLVLLALSFGIKPVVMFHGLLDDHFSMDTLHDRISRDFPGHKSIHSLDVRQWSALELDDQSEPILPNQNQ